MFMPPRFYKTPCSTVRVLNFIINGTKERHRIIFGSSQKDLMTQKKGTGFEKFLMRWSRNHRRRGSTQSPVMKQKSAF